MIEPMWRMVLFLAPLAGLALDVKAPSRIKQGDALKVEVAPFSAGMKAVLLQKSVPLFPREGGRGVAWIPVAVTQKPGSFQLEILDSAGSVSARVAIEVLEASYPTQNIRATKAMKSLTPLPGEVEAMRALYTTVSDKALFSEPFLPPVPHCANSSFGVQRLHNGQPTGNYHRGLDLLSPAGTPVKAATGGKVLVARMFRLHGGTIGIDHGEGFTTHYLHLSRLAAKEGTIVKPGDVVGYVGGTGFATGPHLHWGLYLHAVPVNPRQFAPAVTGCR